jgi:hypothetical protein
MSDRSRRFYDQQLDLQLVRELNAFLAGLGHDLVGGEGQRRSF